MGANGNKAVRTLYELYQKVNADQSKYIVAQVNDLFLNTTF
jgi:hypothetical protein